MVEGNELLNVREVMKYLRISQSTAYRLLAKGAIPAVKIGRSWRVRKETLNDFLEKRIQRG